MAYKSSFIIVADMRTGSTMLAHSLNRHPDVRCLGELFHPQDFPDNQLMGINRFKLSPEEVIRRALSPENGVRAAGFRAMIFLPHITQKHWAAAWDRLREQPDLHIIFLKRRDCLAQYASMCIAEQIGQYHPSPDDPVAQQENRPKVHIDLKSFEEWIRKRQRLLHGAKNN